MLLELSSMKSVGFALVYKLNKGQPKRLTKMEFLKFKYLQ